MTKVVEAIYTHGVLEPLEALDLFEKQRVRVTIEPLDGEGPVDRKAARRALVERLKKSSLSFSVPLPTRDELHEG